MIDRGLRARKKEQTRQRLADVAAALFAERGYDSVSMAEVARLGEVSEPTLYNYFPTKQSLVLDRAEQIRGWYAQAVYERGPGVSPAAAIEPLLHADVKRYAASNLSQGRGEFLAQAVESPVLRRFALEEREQQTEVIVAALGKTDPDVPAIVAHAHAAAIVAVIQAVHDRIGTGILQGAPQRERAAELTATVVSAFAYLDQTFAGLRSSARADPRPAPSTPPVSLPF